MKILLLGEASFIHHTLKQGLSELGHDVTLASDGNKWHDAPRDIDLRRNSKWGALGGLKVLWKLLTNLRTFCGNDVVQIHNYQFVPLKMKWNEWILAFLKRYNRCVFKGCFGDDPQVLMMQSKGIPTYSDTFWNGRQQNVEANKARVAEQQLPEIVSCWQKSSSMADALVACLYEYYLCYNVPPFSRKLHYIPLPIIVKQNCLRRIKGRAGKIKVLVGVQPDRDYMKGAMKIASFIEELNRRNPGRLYIMYVENMPYREYCKVLEEADVLVDQLYSYTPSMNSLAAMACGTVVIGGGEEDFYRFIGEKELRPIINVSPQYSDEKNISIIQEAFFTEGRLSRLSEQSVSFVKKHHDYLTVARRYEGLYRKVLSKFVD